MRRLPLRLIVVLLVAPLAAAAILGTLAFQVHRQEMRRLVGERDERAVRAAAVGLAERVYNQITALRTLADRVSDGVPFQQLVSESEFLFKQFDGGVAFYDPQQRLIAGAPSDEVWAQRPFAYELLTFLGQGSGPVFSPLVADGPTRGVVLFIAVSSARRNVIAVGALSPQQLGIPTFVSGLQATRRASAFLIDLNGQLIYHTDESLIGLDWRDHPGAAEALRGESGSYYRTLPSPQGDLRPDNLERVIAYTPVDPIGWGLVVEEPWVDVVSPLMRYSEVIQFILLPAGLLAAVALFFGVRSIVRPLQLLDEQAARLGWGEFEAIQEPVGGIAEIQALQATLIQMADQVQSYQAGMRGYLAALTQGQEEERKRLARELHDETAQSLIALDQKIQMAQKALGRDPAACVARLDELRAMTTEIVEEVRRFSRNLRPIYLEDLGLIPALEMLTRDVSTGSGGKLATAFHVTGEPKRLTAEREMALYRIVQEALHNVAAHANASRADVTVAFVGETLSSEGEASVTIADDGVGFAIPERPGELAEAGHYGLLGMRERAGLAGGWLGIESEPGRGTRIEIHLPA